MLLRAFAILQGGAIAAWTSNSKIIRKAFANVGIKLVAFVRMGLKYLCDTSKLRIDKY